MKKILFYIILSLPWAAISTLAQQVDAIIHKKSTQLYINSEKDVSWQVSLQATILNEKADDISSFGLQLSNDITLDSFKAQLIDAKGQVIRKYKSSDLNRTEYTSEFASDYCSVYFQPDIPYYPITINYEYTVRQKGNILGYPKFLPQTMRNTKVDNAIYEVHSPADFKFIYQQQNCQIQPLVSEDTNGKLVTTFRLSNLEPMKKEDYTQPYSDIMPKVYLGPASFTYYKTSGSMRSWKDQGLWVWGLLDSKDELPDDAKAKIRQLISTCKTKKEIIATLYNFMGETTRYVSIQLGIGGYQPFPASYVWKNGFGDCKALTNYMRALLKVAGIESIYTLISTHDKQLLTEMANFQQLNHVILEVPMEDGENLFIECTNPKIPLGYIHDDIAGHQAIEITPDGGCLITLPDYSKEQNLNTTTIRIQVLDDGSATLNVAEDYANHRYYQWASFADMPRKEQERNLLEVYTIPQAYIDSITIDNKKEPYKEPHLHIYFNAESKQYAKLTGSRMFIPVNAMHQGFKRARLNRNRIQPIYQESGYMNEENTIIIIPEGFKVESIPADESIENEFGSFSVNYHQIDNKITIQNILTKNAGIFPAEKANLFDALQDKMEKYYKGKIILIKES